MRSGHGRSKHGAWRVYAASDVGRTLPGGSVVKDMQTSFQALSINGFGCLEAISESGKEGGGDLLIVEEKSVVDFDMKKDEILIRACPQSGRTHQIRLHCQYLGIPIRGDIKYEGCMSGRVKHMMAMNSMRKLYHSHILFLANLFCFRHLCHYGQTKHWDYNDSYWFCCQSESSASSEGP